MDNTAYLCFCHDLEDGWYNLTGPDNHNSDWNFPKEVHKFVEEKGWDLKWKQANSWSDNSMYMPDFMKEKQCQ